VFLSIGEQLSSSKQRLRAVLSDARKVTNIMEQGKYGATHPTAPGWSPIWAWAVPMLGATGFHLHSSLYGRRTSTRASVASALACTKLPNPDADLEMKTYG